MTHIYRRQERGCGKGYAVLTGGTFYSNGLALNVGNSGTGVLTIGGTGLFDAN